MLLIVLFVIDQPMNGWIFVTILRIGEDLSDPVQIELAWTHDDDNNTDNVSSVWQRDCYMIPETQTEPQVLPDCLQRSPEADTSETSLTSNGPAKNRHASGV